MIVVEWVLFVGSPRANGDSARIATIIKTSIAEKRPDVVLHEYSVADIAPKGCIGCDYCRCGSCVYDDGMSEILERLSLADGAIVISPVYFAGVPSQFKAVLDRFQPLFWKRQERLRNGLSLPAKKPLYLYVVGGGGDPHGFDGLVTTVRSSFALADYALQDTVSYIGQRKQLTPSSVSLPEVLRD